MTLNAPSDAGLVVVVRLSALPHPTSEICPFAYPFLKGRFWCTGLEIKAGSCCVPGRTPRKAQTLRSAKHACSHKQPRIMGHARLSAHAIANVGVDFLLGSIPSLTMLLIGQSQERAPS